MFEEGKHAGDFIAAVGQTKPQSNTAVLTVGICTIAKTESELLARIKLRVSGNQGDIKQGL